MVLGNISVFTTEDVIKGLYPIICVYHDEDGDWQFFSEKSESYPPLIVSLDQMLKLDETLNAVLNMKKGQKAERVNIENLWRISH